jgi:hypothetical protein
MKHHIYRVNLDKAEPENELVAVFPAECEREFQLALQYVQGSQTTRNAYYRPYQYHGETK